MNGWFDAFREDGGPTLYTFNNRTPVTGDVTTITLLVLFCTLFIAFLVVFPGIRKERFTTFISVTLSLFVGCVILVTQHGSGWHVASTTMNSSYRAFSKEKIYAHVGANVGLQHVNITLRAMPSGNWSDVDFNERFLWSGAHQMGSCYKAALVRGLPYPILTVAEYFSLDQEGFSWGGQYRAAGYYASILLWTSFAGWLLMNLLLVVVPRYGAYMMVFCGTLLVCTDLVYLRLVPRNPLVIRFEGGALEFELGWCFWIVLIAGCICLLEGLIISTVDLMYPNRFSTILEVDYDTPFDRHIIIEESHDRRYKKKTSNAKLEEPPGAGLGSRILRRLSSKTREERLAERSGLDNQAFELDPPKSPWRYPFRRVQGVQGPGARIMLRTDSRDSASSMASTVPHRDPRAPISPLSNIVPVHKELTRTLGLNSDHSQKRYVRSLCGNPRSPLSPGRAAIGQS